jgi:hypothetical protein
VLCGKTRKSSGAWRDQGWTDGQLHICASEALTAEVAHHVEPSCGGEPFEGSGVLTRGHCQNGGDYTCDRSFRSFVCGGPHLDRRRTFLETRNACESPSVSKFSLYCSGIHEQFGENRQNCFRSCRECALIGANPPNSLPRGGGVWRRYGPKTQMARGTPPRANQQNLLDVVPLRSRRGHVWGAGCVLYAQSLRGWTNLSLRRASTARLTLRSQGSCTVPLLVASMTDCIQRRCDFFRFSKTLLPLPPCVFYAVCELKIATQWG